MRKVNGLVAWLALLIVSVAPAIAGTIRDDRLDSQYLGLADQYPSVGEFFGQTSSFSYTASGTLISSEWVLTAAHVVDQAQALSFDIGGAAYTADNWIAFPTWSGNLLSGNDIGLAHLSSAVTNVDPATRYTGHRDLGAVATTVGFGRTGTGLTGATTYDGEKRAGTNVIDGLFNRRTYLFDFDNPTNAADNFSGSATPTDLEFLAAPGDSGGGVFIDTKNGPRLAGVTSFGTALDGNDNSDYGDIAGATRVNVFNRWIDSVLAGDPLPIRSHGPLGTLSGQELVDPWFAVGQVPEPGSIATLALVALLRARRRGR